MTNPLSAGLEAIDQVGKTVDDLTYSREEQEQHITDRHLADAQSDNWLAKSIRPIMASLFTVMWIVLHVAAIFTDVEKHVLESVNNVTMVVIFFYFGSRGLEKVFKRKNMANIKIEENKAKMEMKRAEEAFKIERIKERRELRRAKREDRRN